MSSPRSRRGFGDHHETLDFIETTQYEHPTAAATASINQPIPPGWRQFEHPNGDIYYHNAQLRATTSINIRDPGHYQTVMEARDNHLQSMDDDVSVRRMPADTELVLMEANTTPTFVFVRMFSRARGKGYTWVEEDGIQPMEVQDYWTYVAEFPSHHEELPPNAEYEFLQAVTEARENASNGICYPFTLRQLDLMLVRYHNLVASRAQGRNVTASLGWLIGAVLPLYPSPVQVQMKDDPDYDPDFIMG